MLFSWTPVSDAEETAFATAPATMRATTQAALPQSAEELFRRLELMGQDYDPSLADYYDDNAVIRSTRIYPTDRKRTITLTGAEYKKLIRLAMPLARATGDLSTSTDLTFTPDGDRVRIDAQHYSHRKKYTSPFTWIVGKDGQCKWMILEEISETRP